MRRQKICVIRKIRANHGIVKFAKLAERHRHSICFGYTQPNRPHLRLAQCNIMSVINIIYIQDLYRGTGGLSSRCSRYPR
jgi:hypothetical protein